MMDTDELRNTIWDKLFQAKSAKSVDELALMTAQSTDAVRIALDHEWFAVAGGRASIAYASPSGHKGLV